MTIEQADEIVDSRTVPSKLIDDIDGELRVALAKIGGMIADRVWYEVHESVCKCEYLMVSEEYRAALNAWAVDMFNDDPRSHPETSLEGPSRDMLHLRTLYGLKVITTTRHRLIELY